MGPNAMILVFWMLNYKPIFSLSSFTFIKRLFSSFSLSAIRVVSSAYLRLLLFLLAILIPTCASSSRAFLMIHSACKLNKQSDNILPWPTPFSIWKQSVISCPVLTVAQSCPSLCNPVDWSLPGFSNHGIIQARILEWVAISFSRILECVAISFSRGSSQPRDWIGVSAVSCIAGDSLPSELSGKPSCFLLQTFIYFSTADFFCV